MSTSKSSYKVPASYNFQNEKDIYRTNKAKANKGGDVRFYCFVKLNPSYHLNSGGVLIPLLPR